MKPGHFFVIGAQRSGTTYLYNLLDAHPEIEMAKPVRPEPKFFLDDENFGRGAAYYESTFFTPRVEDGVRMRGEKSTSYIESAVAAERIHAIYPEARILCLLREPLARAISNYRFSVANGFESLSMWEAFSQEDERVARYDASSVSVSPYAYLTRGHYIGYLDVYERVFSRAALHVMVHEELVDGAGGLADLYRFLGVAPDFLPSGLDEVVNSAPGGADRLTSAQTAGLRGVFAESNARLAERYGLDLSSWNP